MSQFQFNGQGVWGQPQQPMGYNPADFPQLGGGMPPQGFPQQQFIQPQFVAPVGFPQQPWAQQAPQQAFPQANF